MSLLTGSGSIYIKSAIATSAGTTTSIVISVSAASAYVSYTIGDWIGSQLFPTGCPNVAAKVPTVTGACPTGCTIASQPPACPIGNNGGVE